MKKKTLVSNIFVSCLHYLHHSVGRLTSSSLTYNLVDKWVGWINPKRDFPQIVVSSIPGLSRELSKGINWKYDSQKKKSMTRGIWTIYAHGINKGFDSKLKEISPEEDRRV